MTTYTTLDSPVGELLLAGEEITVGVGTVNPVTLTSVSMTRQRNAAAPHAGCHEGALLPESA